MRRPAGNLSSSTDKVSAVGLILRGDGIGSARVIETASELKVIGRSGVGYDNVDIQAANPDALG